VVVWSCECAQLSDEKQTFLIAACLTRLNIASSVWGTVYADTPVWTLARERQRDRECLIRCVRVEQTAGTHLKYPGLFVGDLGEGVTQHLLVVVPERRDSTRVRVHHVRGVRAPADTHLHQRYIHLNVSGIQWAIDQHCS
jgi:hypothetical protein